MKKLLLLVIAFFLTTTTFAAAKDQILLYNTPKGDKVLDRLPGNAALIPIYQKKDWVKVGDPRNGHVGWVNKKQVREARNAFFRPNIQTVYIHSDESKNGKPQLNIVAYRNGKKLSQAEAKRMYEQMRKNQIAELKRMRHMTRWMDEVFQPIVILPSAPMKKQTVQQTKTNKILES
ncbi:MAG: hypothetical protein KDH94_07915 [Coxiellaceae bacterium]|nr:hypothetical protein [Coxiellaceae bacterium]